MPCNEGSDCRALSDARRGLETSPGDTRFLLLLARSELALGQVDAAERQTDRLLAQHGEQPELRLGLARLFLEARATGSGPSPAAAAD